MRIEARWVCKPSITLAIIVLFIAFAHLTPCSATEQQNKTLTEISSYHFDAGYYNVQKYAEDSETDFWIMYETKIPYLNITYTAPDIGLLQITLKPTEGNTPYIELSTGWDTDGLTYTNPMLFNETSYILLTPPMRFSDHNTSTIVGGGIVLWEMYKWQNTSGIITYKFTTSDDINFDLVIYPTQPKQGEQINFFTTSNSELNNITWVFPDLDWINESEIMEINDLNTGTYSVYVTGVDDFNKTHTAQTSFTVLPPTLNPQSLDLGIFSISYPETVSQGETISLSSTIDYSMPFPAMIKCELYDPVNNVECKSLSYNVSDSGSKYFNHQLIADEVGVKLLILRLYYDIGAGWIEVSEAETNISITINNIQTSNSILGYHPIMIMIGITLVTILTRNQNND